jgi:7-cyano-7-deazaguanine synthase
MSSQHESSRMNAVILLSGGLDSATVLALAQQRGYTCYTLSVDYGQRHHAELAAAQRIAHELNALEHRVIHVDLAGFGGSALTDQRIAVPVQSSPGIPLTYVPARNTIMLSLALAWAETLQAQDIFIGVNAVDYSGYPDCRPEYIAAFEHMANLATRAAVDGKKITVHAPLMRLSKGEIIQWGMELGVDYSLTVSCYQADEEGRACALCDACRLRRAGFEQAVLSDPTRYRSV